MKIAVIDEDRRQVPELIDYIRLDGHVVKQIADWRLLVEEITAFEPDLLLLDLMMPAWGIPPSDCFAGYGTGAYVYETTIRVHFPALNFVVFSGVDPSVSIVKRITDRLKGYSTYRGSFSKDDIDGLQAFIKEFQPKKG